MRIHIAIIAATFDSVLSTHGSLLFADRERPPRLCVRATVHVRALCTPTYLGFPLCQAGLVNNSTFTCCVEPNLPSLKPRLNSRLLLPLCCLVIRSITVNDEFVLFVAAGRLFKLILGYVDTVGLGDTDLSQYRTATRDEVLS